LLEGINSHQIASFPNRNAVTLAKNLLDCVERTLAKTLFTETQKEGIVQHAEKESIKEPRGGFVTPSFRFASTRTCTHEHAALNDPENEPEGDADPDPDPGPKTLYTCFTARGRASINISLVAAQCSFSHRNPGNITTLNEGIFFCKIHSFKKNAMFL
jgi:hypothetical protein